MKAVSAETLGISRSNVNVILGTWNMKRRVVGYCTGDEQTARSSRNSNKEISLFKVPRIKRNKSA